MGKKPPIYIITEKRGFVYMRKVKILPIFCAIFLLFSTFAASITGFAAFSPSFEIYSEGVYMVNLDKDIVIVSKNADKRLYPASTTKIMTLLVALENIKDFSATVSCPYECFNEFAVGNPNYSGVSNAEIQPLQSNLTYEDCLYALMLPSACDAANVIAYNVGGSLEGFVNMMNDTAARLGCKNTHFANAHGLFNENNYSTAYDMYLITRYAIDNYPGFLRICDTPEYEMPANSKYPSGYTLYHTNELMKPTSKYYCEGVHGVKTGSIDHYYHMVDGKWDYQNAELGSRALVSTAERNGYNYLLVTLGAPYYNEDGTATESVYSFTDHINLYNWAFSEFEYVHVIEENQQIMQAAVEKGENADTVGIVTTEDFYTLMPKSLDISSIQQIKPTVDTLTAPVVKGTPMGELELRLNGETLTTIPLVTESDIPLDAVANYREKLHNILTAPQTIAAGIILTVLIAALIVIRTINKAKRRKAAEMQRRRKIRMAPKYNNKNYRR